jgi:trans-aconitate methyltransferase
VATSPEQTLIEMLAPQPGERVLDAGCGLGRWTAELAASGARVTGIDIHAPLLEQARIVCPRAEFIAADLLTWAPAEPFDAIYAFATLHWVHPPDSTARALYRMLKPAGRLAAAFGGLSATVRELEGCYQPEPDEYTRVLKAAGFAILEMRRAEQHFLVLARREK